MGEYKITDIILGKQRSYSMGRGTSGVKFKVFPEALQDKIREYTLENMRDDLISILERHTHTL